MKPINQDPSVRFTRPQEIVSEPCKEETSPVAEEIDECPLIVCIGLKAYFNFTCLADYDEADQQKIK